MTDEKLLSREDRFKVPLVDINGMEAWAKGVSDNMEVIYNTINQSEVLDQKVLEGWIEWTLGSFRANNEDLAKHSQRESNVCGIYAEAHANLAMLYTTLITLAHGVRLYANVYNYAKGSDGTWELTMHTAGIVATEGNIAGADRRRIIMHGDTDKGEYVVCVYESEVDKNIMDSLVRYIESVGSIAYAGQPARTIH